METDMKVSGLMIKLMVWVPIPMLMEVSTKVNGLKISKVERVNIIIIQGKESWLDGSYYKGGYFNGTKNGHGKFYWADGSYYDGQFCDNQISGKGKNLDSYLGRYNWLDGRIYDGEWKESKMNGEGIFYWPNGRKYIGEFVNDKKEGYGIHEWYELIQI